MKLKSHFPYVRESDFLCSLIQLNGPFAERLGVFDYASVVVSKRRENKGYGNDSRYEGPLWDLITNQKRT